MQRYRLVFKRNVLGVAGAKYTAIVGTLEQINEHWVEIVCFNDYSRYTKPEFVSITEEPGVF